MPWWTLSLGFEEVKERSGLQGDAAAISYMLSDEAAVAQRTQQGGFQSARDEQQVGRECLVMEHGAGWGVENPGGVRTCACLRVRLLSRGDVNLCSKHCRLHLARRRVAGQVALEAADLLMNTCAAGEAPWDGIRGGLAERYREAGFREVADFITAA